MTPIIPPTTQVPPPTLPNRPLPNPDQLLKNQAQNYSDQGRVRKYTALSLFLPPMGLYLAWRDRLLHLVVPSLLLAETILFGLSTFLSLFLLKPVLTYLNADTSGISLLNPVYGSLVALMALFFGLGLIVSIYYKRHVHYNGHLGSKPALIILLIYLAHLVLTFACIFYFNYLLTPALEKEYQNLQQTQDFLSQ